jgi:hypothetical protein
MTALDEALIVMPVFPFGFIHETDVFSTIVLRP